MIDIQSISHLKGHKYKLAKDLLLSKCRTTKQRLKYPYVSKPQRVRSSRIRQRLIDRGIINGDNDAS